MNQLKLEDKPMTLYNYFCLLLSGKGNAAGIGAITLQTSGFVFNPTLLTGLAPILTGVGMFVFSVWQKKKDEVRKEELHQKQLQKVDEERKSAVTIAEINEEKLKKAKLETKLLEEKIANE